MRSLWLKLLLSLALLAWLLSRTPLAALAQELGHLAPIVLLAGAALSVAAWLISALRLWCVAPGFGLATLTRMTFIGMLYGTLLPGQVAGDLVKAWRLSHAQTAPGHAAAATLVDRGIATLALFAIGALAATRLPEVPQALRVLFVLATLAIAAAGALLSIARVQRMLVALLRTRGDSHLARILGVLERLAHALHDALRRPARLAASFALALAFHALCIAIHVLLAHALGLNLGPSAWCLVYAGVSLLMLLPISVAGIGLREGGYVGLLALFGVHREAALALSFTFLGYTLLGALIGAAVELSEMVHARRRVGHPTTVAATERENPLR